MRPPLNPAYATQTADPAAVRESALVEAMPVPGAVPQLRWQASARPTAPARPSRQSPPSMAGSGGFLVQAGSFRSTDNAEKARSALSGIAQVEVAPFQVGGKTMFRVRVGPFAEESAANAALARVTEAGYTDAKIVAN